MKGKEISYKSFLFNIFFDNKLFISYIIFSVLISFTLRLVTVGGFFNIVALITDTLFVILFGSFGYLFKEKNRYIYYLSLIIFFSILCFVNTIYYQFYQSFVSINLISTASMIGEVNDSLFAKIHLIQFIYYIYPISYYFIRKYLFSNLDSEYSLKEKKLFRVIFLPCVFIILFVISLYSIKDASKFNNQYNREYIVKKYGLYLYTVNDLFQSFEFNDNIDYDNYALKYRNYYACKWSKSDSVNSFTDKFKGKNVLFIHAESIQNFLIDLTINGKEVIPNINKFAKEGIYFSKFYPQISVGTSSDTEFTLLTGLLPSSNGTVFVNYYDRKYYGLPYYFNNIGYYTFSMHGNNRDYWNRAVMHDVLGYNDFYGEESYIIPSIDSNDYIGMGISDKEFFRQSIPMLKNIKENNSNFYGTLITLSNHSPFNDIGKYGDFDVSSKYEYLEDGEKYIEEIDYLENTTMGNYIKSSHYADGAFGELMESLEEEGLLDNLVIVFYGDHESRISKKEFDLLYNFDPISGEMISEDDPSYVNVSQYYYELLRNTPLIIWSGDEEFNMEINEVMGMYDVLPTIANMFGFNESYSLGHDIFSNEENIVVFPNGNILTDKVYYSDVNDEYITFTDNAIDSDYISRIREYANNILEVSNGIIKYDLIDKEGRNVGECNEKR